MAFSINELVQMSTGNGYSHWRYDTLDIHATVDSAGYFADEAVNMLSIGDLIDVAVWATAVRTGTISTYGRHIVLSNDGSTVDVSNVTVGVVTDTD